MGNEREKGDKRADFGLVGGRIDHSTERGGETEEIGEVSGVSRGVRSGRGGKEAGKGGLTGRVVRTYGLWFGQGREG